MKKLALPLSVLACTGLSFVAPAYAAPSTSASNTIMVSVNGKGTLITSSAKTVGDMLTEQKINVGKMEFVSPSRDTLLSDTQIVTVNTMTVKTTNKTVVVPFKKVSATKAVVCTTKATSKVTQIGANGSAVQTMATLTIQGQQPITKLMKTTVVTKAVDQVTSPCVQKKPTFNTKTDNTIKKTVTVPASTATVTTTAVSSTNISTSSPTASSSSSSISPEQAAANAFPILVGGTANNNGTTTTGTTTTGTTTTTTATATATSTPTTVTITGTKTDWLTAAGVSQSDWAYVNYIVSHESSWNPLAVNASSGATGLCQALPGSKMASAGSDWKTNPVTQMKWCNSYAQQRYSGWANAYAFWVANHWW